VIEKDECQGRCAGAGSGCAAIALLLRVGQQRRRGWWPHGAYK
jgi:hypothetical protein